MYKIEIHYSFKPNFAVRIGSGHGKYGIIDSAYRMRADSSRREKITIPATTVKGRIRYTFERLINLFSNVDENIGKQIFGESGIEGWARFSDLLLKEEEDALLGEKASTAIDRFRRGAKSKTLRVEEFAMLKEDKCFYGMIEGYVMLEEMDMNKEMAVFLLSILHNDSFGGSKSTGYGKGKMCILSLKIGTNVYDEKTIKEKMKQLLT